jgi:hypothetical protein
VSTIKKITTGLVAGATLVAVASPAEAQWRYRRGGDRTALAVGAGALGVAVGAALASSNRGWRGDRWGRGYYGRGWDRGFYGGPRGYAYGYGRPGWGAYDGWYGAPRARCWRERVWDDWRGRWRRVRVCDRW